MNSIKVEKKTRSKTGKIRVRLDSRMLVQKCVVEACCENDYDGLMQLLRTHDTAQYASDTLRNFRDAFGCNIVRIACGKDATDIVRFLLSLYKSDKRHFKALMTHRDIIGDSLFHEVCYKQNTSVFEVLCDMCPCELLKECMEQTNNCGQVPFDMLIYASASPREASRFHELLSQKAESESTLTSIRRAVLSMLGF
jgi:hypothetical protein